MNRSLFDMDGVLYPTEECMQLYLVQHGTAKSEAEDPQRGLTAEGTKTVEQMARYLSQMTLHVDRIEHSGKERARQGKKVMQFLQQLGRTAI